MNTHVQPGLEMIGKVLGQYDLNTLPGVRVLCNVIRHHHERLDGSGYPEGLKGEAISLEGRIEAVADVFDAVVSRRAYHAGCTIQQGLAVVQQEAAAVWRDSECVAELEQVLV